MRNRPRTKVIEKDTRVAVQPTPGVNYERPHPPGTKGYIVEEYPWGRRFVRPSIRTTNTSKGDVSFREEENQVGLRHQVWKSPDKEVRGSETTPMEDET